MSIVKSPLVSVLIPIYNCESYLHFTLNSLKAQTLQEFEVILVNDGSLDGSLAILNEFAETDARFKVYNQKNQGIVAALNHGLAQAIGKYIARLDGDDIAHPDRLRLQYEYMETHPNCVCVGSIYRAINEKGDLIWQQKVFSSLKQTNLKTFPPHVATLPHPSIMLRYADLKALNGYRSYFPHAEDYDLFLRLSRLGSLDIIPLYLLDYRVHQSSLSSKNLQAQIDSAMKALLAAIILQLKGSDPFKANQQLDLDGLYKMLPDRLTRQLFYFLKDLRQVSAWMNRQDLEAANHVLWTLFNKVIADFQHCFLDKRYWQFIFAMLKIWLKIKLKRI
ncbi:MAG TPA: glycosyltransferase family 2 protein [Methylophilaceae bacterium]|jgi:glycosyltransferase involved in cell wall biosynthesis